MTTPATQPPTAGDDLRAAAHAMVAGCDVLSRANWSDHEPDLAIEILDLLTLSSRKLTAINADVIQVINASKIWSRDGTRSPHDFIINRTGSSRRTAGEQIRNATAFAGDFAPISKALKDGRISPDQAQTIRRESSRSDTTKDAALAGGLNNMIDEAERSRADQTEISAKSWAITTDPEGAARQWRRSQAKEFLAMTTTTDGVALRGFLTHENGALARKAYLAAIGRKPRESTDTFEERLAQGLIATCHQSLEQGFFMKGARVRPHIAVNVDLETVVGLMEASGSAIPPALAELLPDGVLDSSETESRPRAGRASTPPRHEHRPINSGTPTRESTHPPGRAHSPGTTHPSGRRSPDTTRRPQEIRRPHEKLRPTAVHPPGFGISGSAALETLGGSRFPDDTFDEEKAHRLSSEFAKYFRPGDPHVIPTALDHERLKGLAPAQLENGEPIPFETLAYFACGGSFFRVIFDSQKIIIDAGREKRLFTREQTQAIYHRDRSCRFPGCGSPDYAGEIHHALYWLKHQGPTRIDVGILLCRFHHMWVHAHEVTICWVGSAWEFTTADGRVLSDRVGPGSTHLLVEAPQNS